MKKDTQNPEQEPKQKKPKKFFFRIDRSMINPRDFLMSLNPHRDPDKPSNLLKTIDDVE